MARPLYTTHRSVGSCPEMWHHYVFDEQLTRPDSHRLESRNSRLLHLGGTLNSRPGIRV